MDASRDNSLQPIDAIGSIFQRPFEIIIFQEQPYVLNIDTNSYNIVAFLVRRLELFESAHYLLLYIGFGFQLPGFEFWISIDYVTNKAGLWWPWP